MEYSQDFSMPNFAGLDSTNFLLVAVISFLIGSIPFAIILGKIFGIRDIRQVGSGNPGATNMFKNGSKKVGAMTLVLDLAKGSVTTYIGYKLEFAAAAALFAVLGHCFSIFLKFKGGKGVATFIGAILVLCPPAGACFIAIWVAVFAAFRISSLSALVAINSLIFISAVMWAGNVFWVVLVLAILVTVRHRSNIKRLLEGTEK